MSRPAGQRGSVLVLVAAVLALLAVLATVYVTIARTSVQSARMTSAGMNLDLARDAAMSQVRTLLFSATTDSQGVIGGLTSRHGTAVGKTSRYYDYPECGTTVGQTDANAECPDEAWLTKGAYPASSADFSRIMAYGFNPAKNDASVAVQTATLNAVGDPDHSDPDAGAYLLSYSSGSGERYRFGVRIVDLSGMANLNTGAARTVTDPQGRYLSSYFLGSAAALEQSRQGGYAAGFSLEDWQKQMLSIEQTPATGITLFDLSDELALRAYGTHGTPYVCRPAYALAGLQSGNSLRGDYTTYSFSRDLRLRPDPALPAPSTMPSTAPATMPAGPPSPPYTLTPSDGKPFPTDCGMYVWPLMPEKVWINPRLDPVGAVDDSIFYHARAATNIATAMEQAGYSPEEARAFAANYLSYRWNGWVKDGQTGGFYAPGGPSFVDDQGICVRVADASGAVTTRDFAGSSDLRCVLPGEDAAKRAKQLFAGYLPQPFINEVVALMRSDPDTGAAIISDAAVELYNPYPIALSLKGFKLIATGNTTDLSAVTVAAHGYVTIVQQAGGVLASKVATGSPVVASSELVLDNGGSEILLTRPYIPRGKGALDAPGDATIDEYVYSNLVLPKAAPEAKIYFMRRSNEASSPSWQCAQQTEGATERYIDGESGQLTLGAANADAGSGVELAIEDRYSHVLAGDSSESPVAQADPLSNFGEFNRVMRVCNESPVASTQPSDPISIPRTLSRQLGRMVDQKIPEVEVAGTDFPLEAQLHFDFKAVPQFFAGADVPAGSSLKPGDARAVKLFDYLAMVDRVPDRTIDVGEGPVSIDKMRIAGRINVNTANRNVLLGLPNLTPAMADAIVAYRDRTGAFADASVYPGKGIRTLAELLVPLTQSASGSPANLHQRDEVWASVINLCTTRSDTFAVYGYLEAIRANSTVAHNNGSDWYDVAGTSDDPHSATAKNIRMARVRWLAIVDRSWCNYGRGSVQFTLPRVVAIENLSP